MSALPGRDSATSVTCIADAAGLAAFAPAWERLFDDAGDATPFQHPAWLLPWWRAFAPGELRVLVASAGGRPVALAPLYVERGVQRAKLLPIGISLSDYGGPLVAADAPPDVLAALSDAIGRLDADRLDWPDLPPGSPALAIPAPAGWRREDSPGDSCPVLDTAAEGGGVPALRRRKRRMAAHRAERAGGARLTDLEEAGPDAFLDALEKLHRARWEERGEPGVLDDARVRAFHRAALPRLQRAGLADAWLLAIGGRLAGAYYGLRRGPHAYAYLSGFEPSFRRESPGVLLIGSVIERCHREGIRTLHFLRGREPYKYEWGAVDSWTSRMSLVRADG